MTDTDHNPEICRTQDRGGALVSNRNDGQRYILVRGNLSDGFVFYGPFNDFDEADEFNADLEPSESWIASLEHPPT